MFLSKIGELVRDLTHNRQFLKIRYPIDKIAKQKVLIWYQSNHKSKTRNNKRTIILSRRLGVRFRRHRPTIVAERLWKITEHFE